jgi:hypothetical protein
MHKHKFRLQQNGGWKRPMTPRLQWAPTRHGQAGDGFYCIHCHAYVSTATFLSGVGNRNHCPYCLWSRHLDLYAAGDRLSACKAPMAPVGLAFKHAPKKYGNTHGELMLIHSCSDCGAISLNRIAADDVSENIMRVFEQSQHKDVLLEDRLEKLGIIRLGISDMHVVQRQLYGSAALCQTAPCPV